MGPGPGCERVFGTAHAWSSGLPIVRAGMHACAALIGLLLVACELLQHTRAILGRLWRCLLLVQMVCGGCCVGIVEASRWACALH